ncbi:MAG TPA: SDR family NAD(P)-dependent oxidoreductase [Solirubrobacteraceae bacterium]|nr:SDR family NAD(P)-dependent oxidoreductase [Solirubrobacteraceae bacterium]
MPRYPLADRAVIITGAAGGIGAASARALVARGAQVTLVDLGQDAVDELAASLPADRVLARAADVTHIEQMAGVVEATRARFGKVDVVFANAGIANDPPMTLDAAELETYERVIEVDLLGVVRTIKPALPEVIANRGHVLITASIYAFVNGVINSAYAVSKAGVEMLGRSLRLELAPAGASAGVLYPGWVATPLVAVVRGRDPVATAFKQRVFPGRLGAFIDPDEIATAVADGIEARAARIIRPKLWAPVSALRGVFNNVSDELLRHDKATLAHIKQIDSNARKRRAG